MAGPFVSSPIYSTRFIAEQGLAGIALYTVPLGFVAVVRDIDAYNGGSLSPEFLFFEGTAGQTIWKGTGTMDPVNPQWSGRQVFVENEAFSFFTTGTWDVTASGYLLRAP